MILFFWLVNAQPWMHQNENLTWNAITLISLVVTPTLAKCPRASTGKIARTVARFSCRTRSVARSRYDDVLLQTPWKRGNAKIDQNVSAITDRNNKYYNNIMLLCTPRPHARSMSVLPGVPMNEDVDIGSVVSACAFQNGITSDYVGDGKSAIKPQASFFRRNDA